MRNQTSEELRHYAFQGAAVLRRDLTSVRLEFERQAQWYGRFFKGMLPDTLHGPVLDMPCGHGNFLYFLRARGIVQMRGVDIDESRVAVAQALGLPAVQGDGLLSIAAARDLALLACIDFFEHVERERIPKLIQDCSAALRPNGVLLIRMPITDCVLGAYDLYNDFTHKWSANSHVIRELLIKEGFRSVAVKDERPFFLRWYDLPRMLAFYPMKVAVNGCLLALGFPRLKFWSRSVWFMALK